MKTKKSLVLLLVLILSLGLLTACGGASASSESGENAAVPPMNTAAPNDNAPVRMEEKEGTENEQGKALAESYVGKSVEELIAQLGEPVSRDYAPSCLGPGEDGELSYDGFTVYTYRENGSETVHSVA